MRLLPNDKDISWLPYAYLLYLAIFLAFPVFSHASIAVWLRTALGIAVFLPFYFLSYWVDGRNLLLVVAAITAIGVLYAPSNPGASVFFVYAAAAVAFAKSSRVAWAGIAAVVVVIAIEGMVLHLSAQFWGFAGAFSVFVGAMNIHVSQRKLANAKLSLAYDEIERLAKVAERERIARDLHDLLGHTLSLIVLKSELTGKLIDRDPERARQEIRELEQVSRNALNEVREAVRGYRSGNLWSEMARARTTLETAGVSVDCQADSIHLPPAQENVIALALREGVTNIVRHANATRCAIRVTVAEGRCAMEIEDNGCGGTAVEGNGLRGMRERAEALGGTVKREVNNGCRLALALPLNPLAPPRDPLAPPVDPLAPPLDQRGGCS
jgi:two-component system sensor histidine kinase DesK